MLKYFKASVANCRPSHGGPVSRVQRWVRWRGLPDLAQIKISVICGHNAVWRYLCVRGTSATACGVPDRRRGSAASRRRRQSRARS
ncbi:hypothetical protein EVAR_55224_1 [Eumeta japonica]|uniref:Uncharacterized protein n=1 Tax=Eumeta variegata TaxID=151549 RepID=A0A4C1ZQZ8_EUMVA|nr:hypothetical protein EVAR_55224_1 [Eumeta japonica]